MALTKTHHNQILLPSVDVEISQHMFLPSLYWSHETALIS